MTVDHDRTVYKSGAVVPCTDEQAALMPSAVEQVQVSVAEKTKRK